MTGLSLLEAVLAAIVLTPFLLWFTYSVLELWRMPPDDPRWEEISELQRLEEERDMFRRY